MPSFTLGKDCTVIVGGVANSNVRSVTWSASAKELEVHPYNSMRIGSWTTGYERTVEIEFLDDPSLWSTLEMGTKIQISWSGGSGSFVITNITRSEPLDDAVTVRVQAKYSAYE
jgi:hypothetical protein